MTDRSRATDAPVGARGADQRVQRGLELAYRYLNARDRTAHELRCHLERRGVDADPTDTTIRTLIDQGYLDDARFARLLAEDKRELEDWGTERIRQALLARGVERDVVDATLGDQPPGDDLERALELLQRRFPSPPRSPRDQNRAIHILVRKGYDSETAWDALSGYLRLP